MSIQPARMWGRFKHYDCRVWVAPPEPYTKRVVPFVRKRRPTPAADAVLGQKNLVALILSFTWLPEAPAPNTCVYPAGYQRTAADYAEFSENPMHHVRGGVNLLRTCRFLWSLRHMVAHRFPASIQLKPHGAIHEYEAEFGWHKWSLWWRGEWYGSKSTRTATPPPTPTVNPFTDSNVVFARTTQYRPPRNNDAYRRPASQSNHTVCKG